MNLWNLLPAENERKRAAFWALTGTALAVPVLSVWPTLAFMAGAALGVAAVCKLKG